MRSSRDTASSAMMPGAMAGKCRHEETRTGTGQAADVATAHCFLVLAAVPGSSSSGTLQDTALAEWYQDAATALTLAPAERHILVGEHGRQA